MIRLKLKGKVLSEERKEGLPERQEPKEKPKPLRGRRRKFRRVLMELHQRILGTSDRLGRETLV